MPRPQWNGGRDAAYSPPQPFRPQRTVNVKPGPLIRTPLVFDDLGLTKTAVTAEWKWKPDIPWQGLPKFHFPETAAGDLFVESNPAPVLTPVTPWPKPPNVWNFGSAGQGTMWVVIGSSPAPQAFAAMVNQIAEQWWEVIGTNGNHEYAAEVRKITPGLEARIQCPQEHAAPSLSLYNMRLWDLVQHLNDQHKWSYERIADWLDRLEETGAVDLTVNIEMEEA